MIDARGRIGSMGKIGVGTSSRKPVLSSREKGDGLANTPIFTLTTGQAK